MLREGNSTLYRAFHFGGVESIKICSVTHIKNALCILFTQLNKYEVYFEVLQDKIQEIKYVLLYHVMGGSNGGGNLRAPCQSYEINKFCDVDIMLHYINLRK